MMMMMMMIISCDKYFQRVGAAPSNSGSLIVPKGPLCLTLLMILKKSTKNTKKEKERNQTPTVLQNCKTTKKSRGMRECESESESE